MTYVRQRKYTAERANECRQINLIYLGILTNRVPILPMFTPSHIGGGVPPIDFGEVFDIPRLRISLHKPLVEWYEVKNRTSEAVDELGCWNVWEAVQDREHSPRWSSLPDRLKLGKFASKVIRKSFDVSPQISRIRRHLPGLNSFLTSSTTCSPISPLCRF